MEVVTITEKLTGKTYDVKHSHGIKMLVKLGHVNYATHKDNEGELQYDLIETLATLPVKTGGAS